MKLGPFQITHPFVLAPMAGITHSAFRRLMKRQGCPLVISELVSANGIEHMGPKSLDLLRYDEEERPVGLQIFGEGIENLVSAAKKVEECKADFVDLNLGCPVPKVTKRGAGSALCRDPRALGEILEAMVRAVKIPVTIKIRTGWDENTKNAHEVIRVAYESGVSWVAIHGRTRAQGYSGKADWNLIGELKLKSPLPIIGNGDIINAEQAVNALKNYGVDAVMIGRGILRNPFLFEQAAALLDGVSAKPITTERYLDIFKSLRNFLEGERNPHAAMIHARKFLAWYSAGFPGSSEFRRRVFSLAEPNELWELSYKFFEHGLTHRTQDFWDEPFLMGGHG